MFYKSIVCSDSPKKKPTRRLSRGKSNSNAGSSKRQNKKIQIPLSKTGHNIVVVKEASAQPSKSNDPDLLKLQVIEDLFNLCNFISAF